MALKHWLWLLPDGLVSLVVALPDGLETLVVAFARWPRNKLGCGFCPMALFPWLWLCPVALNCWLGPFPGGLVSLVVAWPDGLETLVVAFALRQPRTGPKWGPRFVQ